MKNRFQFLFSTVILALFLLAACNQPVKPETPAANVAFTAAAMTVNAQLTEESQATLAPTVDQPTLTSATATQPMATDTPTITSSPTASISVTATDVVSTTITSPAPASDPRTQLGKPAWEDKFKNGRNWAIFDDDHVEMKFSDDQLFMSALRTDRWLSWIVTWPVVSQVYIEMTAQPEKCSGLDQYGFLALAPTPNEGYVYGFSCDGRYALRLWDGEKMKTLVDWTTSPFILSGANQKNRLGFMAKDGKISLYANGNLLTEIEDDEYQEGAFGPFIGAAQTAGFTVHFLEIAYWDLPE